MALTSLRHIYLVTFLFCTFFYEVNSSNHSLPTAELPTNYEYFTADGINSGLNADNTYFTLNGKEMSIYSGAIHYFRVPKVYWRDRLRKLRAAGFNTIETYIPWNLHEYQSGKYDFGSGGSDMQDFLDVTEFLKTAQEEDLLAIVRSGPFICAEFEFGGFPSWLLHGKKIQNFRTSDSVYMEYVTRYFNVLIPILAELQFTKGGPIIAFQVENEYALLGSNADKDYLKALRQLLLDNGIVELLVTSDNPPRGTVGTIPELFLMTGNFDTDPVDQLDQLKALQPNKPLMTMEYWAGWFDYWGQSHQTKTPDTFRDVYEAILKYPSSVNIYMFHGGTNFGFLNGASNTKFDDENTGFDPVSTSYDYDSLITEAGDYTEKYYIAQELLAKYNTIQTKLPDAPELVSRVAYSSVSITQQISLADVLTSVQPESSSNLINMEELSINDNSGQSYGYIVYRKEHLKIEANAELLIEGRVCDTIMVLVNGQLVSHWLEDVRDLDYYGTWRTKDSVVTLSSVDLEDATLDLVVENWGRVNVAVYKQYKGLYQGNALINNVVISDWSIFPLEFKKSWTNSLSNWQPVNFDTIGPTLYKGVLEISDEPKDTFVYVEDWMKGIVVVNGFVVGRYCRMGPTQTLYLPAPLLKKGTNDIVIFEHFVPNSEVAFATDHVYVIH